MTTALHLLMIPFSGSDTEVKSWTCLVHDLPIAWSGLTQNTLDLSTLNTDLAPDCHVVGWVFFYCIHFCLVGIASFCKLCKRQFEVNSFGFFHVFYFENEYRPLSLSMIRHLVVNWMSNVALQYTPYYIWQFIEKRCHLCLNF